MDRTFSNMKYNMKFADFKEKIRFRKEFGAKK